MLVVESVWKSYAGGAPVLSGASICLEAGEKVALVGPSGSGKSTLLNLIGLLDRPDQGDVRIDGRSFGGLLSAEAARLRNELIGFVFQSFHLLPRLTAWENVALPLFHRGLGRVERKARALAMLDRVGLSDRVDHRPEQMSGGQRQRVAIARALVGGPRLILADEPTGNLDSATGLQVMDLLGALNRELGVTILMITHDREMARLCDRVIEIRDGRILPQEPAE
ncbi:MAG: ABC transporter ATP-binding protein [Candidatus Brevundimonas phytovorans]|nr:ABC transporter ATP-binding protein [Brevundimonas sp.]WEK58623.1 MAG: ABC transporter ATP-binding protein [Brevundimonas sp.]